MATDKRSKTLSIVTDYEYKRTNKNLFIARFIKNGEWLKAVEFSAYLCNNLPFDNTLNIQKYSLKGLDTGYLHCGCKINSIPKFFKKLEDKIEYITESNTVKELYIDVSEYFVDSNITLENYLQVLEQAKDEVIFSDDSNNTGHSNKEFSIKGSLQKILSYPLESKTPIQTIQFLSDLKIELSKLL